ncbi:unnamed protein product [Rhizoctonia solani]|uniref:Uncharacterized protein n=1 Tax=Rhizoctonia solani TaxID=456999 RepID=A0A8H3CR50_9AGAM|nr:unnamed protein product [Rhizoctonia solani]
MISEVLCGTRVTKGPNRNTNAPSPYLQSNTRWLRLPIQSPIDPRGVVLPANNGFPVLHPTNRAPQLAVSTSNLSSHIPAFDNSMVGQQESYGPLSITISCQPGNIPRNPELNPFDFDNMKNLIMVEYGRLARRASFRPFPYPVEAGLVNHLLRGSSLVRMTLYLGARISRALFDDTNWQDYIGWIENFHNQILGSHSSLILVNNEQLAERLAAHCRLAVFAFMISNSSIGYTIFRRGVPIFLQLAIKFPNLWQDDSTISLSRTLHTEGHELARFVVLDVITSLAFGIPSLIRYGNAIHPTDYKPRRFEFLEPVYACPVVVFMTLARVNEYRVSRLLDQDSELSQNVGEYETAVRNWKPRVDYGDPPSELIARLAVQESWRQATLIYLYMGMCGVDSSDSRVERLVRQVAELASTIEAGSALEAHLFIPCLIAGVAARKEKHRMVLRKKIQVSQGTDACLLREYDTVIDGKNVRDLPRNYIDLHAPPTKELLSLIPDSQSTTTTLDAIRLIKFTPTIEEASQILRALLIKRSGVFSISGSTTCGSATISLTFAELFSTRVAFLALLFTLR